VCKKKHKGLLVDNFSGIGEET